MPTKCISPRYYVCCADQDGPWQDDQGNRYVILSSSDPRYSHATGTFKTPTGPINVKLCLAESAEDAADKCGLTLLISISSLSGPDAGVLTHTQDDGTQTNHDLISGDAGNQIVSGTDGALFVPASTDTSSLSGPDAGQLTHTQDNGSQTQHQLISADLGNDIVAGTDGALFFEETVTLLEDNGDGSFNYLNEAGDIVQWAETITTFVNNGDGTLTYTNENGDQTVVPDDNHRAWGTGDAQKSNADDVTVSDPIYHIGTVTSGRADSTHNVGSQTNLRDNTALGSNDHNFTGATNAASGGSGNSVTGSYSFSYGIGNTSGNQSATFGNGNVATGTRSFAANISNQALAPNSAAFGSTTIVQATGNFSFATGFRTDLSGQSSLGGGRDCGSDAQDTFVIGNNNSITGGNQSWAGGTNNSVTGGNSIAHGNGNTASGTRSAVFCGLTNIAAGTSSFVVGSNNNNSGESASITGGKNNVIAAGATDSVIAGGIGNTINAGATESFIAGQDNTINGTGPNVAIGESNTVGNINSVAIGYRNSVTGQSSNAFGQGSSITHSSAVLICASDGGGVNPFASAADNEVGISGSGGVRVRTNATHTVGADLPAGGSAWVAVSERSKKKNYTPLDGGEILRFVKGLNIEKWSYLEEKTDSGDDAYHIGPYAEEWRELGLGVNDRTVTPLDLAGVALVAIKALSAEVESLKQTIRDLEENNS